MPLLIGMGLTSLVIGLLTWLQQYYLARLEVKVALAQSARFFWHTLRLPIDFYNQRFAGDIAYRVEANDRVAQLLERPVGHQRGQHGLGRLLRGGHVLFRPAPRRGRDRHGPPQHRGAAAGRTPTRGRQPPLADGSGSPRRGLDGRDPAGRDPEGERGRKRLLRQVGRVSGALLAEQSVSRLVFQPSQRRARPAQLAGDCRHPRHRRAAGDRGRPDGRRADRVPGADEQLHAADRKSGAVRGQPADDQGRPRPAR